MMTMATHQYCRAFTIQCERLMQMSRVRLLFSLIFRFDFRLMRWLTPPHDYAPDKRRHEARLPMITR